jgi:hypothetical protein
MRSLFLINVRILQVMLLTISWGTAVCPQSIAPSSQEPARNIELLRWNQPNFEERLNENYRETGTVQSFEAAKPFVALLRNDSSHGINAFVVRWTIIEGNGRKYELTQHPWVGAGAGGTLTGEKVVWRPHEVRLISPWFDWTPSSDAASRSKVLEALSRGRLNNSAESVLSVDIWLDAVVYDDGIFAGPDKGNFFDRYECQQKGELNEGAFALSLLELGLSDDEIIARLNADVEKGSFEGGVDQDSLLNSACAKEASLLLVIFKRSGRGGLKDTSMRLVSTQRTVLRRR